MTAEHALGGTAKEPTATVPAPQRTPHTEPVARTSFVLLPADDGDVTVTAELADALRRRLGAPSSDTPVLALPCRADRPVAGRHRSVARRVADHLADVRAGLARHPAAAAAAPLVLVGRAGGAVTAVELARALRAAGHQVALVVLLDPGWLHPHPSSREGLGGERGATLAHVRHLAGRRASELSAAVRAGATTTAALPSRDRASVLQADTAAAVGAHRLAPYDGAVLFVRAARSPVAALGRWRAVCRGPFTLHVAPGHHDGPDGFLAPAHLPALADVLVDAARAATR